MIEESGLPLRPPEVDLVPVGELLGDVAAALHAAADSFDPGGAVIETQTAFRRLAEVTERMAAAFAHVQIAVPKELGSDG